ncbi:MAG: hypothetical protein VW455_05410 [Nitrospinota bacterium]
MAEINDTGKVWIKGSVGPVHAVRVDDKIIATGIKEEPDVELWVDNKGLCIDLHDPPKKMRTARIIPLNSNPSLNGTLFNGFEKTKHADVMIVSSDCEESKEKTVSGENYQEGGYEKLDTKTFWQKVWESW